MGLAALDCSFCSMDLLLLMLNHRLHLHNRSGFELLYYINALGVPMSATKELLNNSDRRPLHQV